VSAGAAQVTPAQRLTQAPPRQAVWVAAQSARCSTARKSQVPLRKSQAPSPEYRIATLPWQNLAGAAQSTSSQRSTQAPRWQTCARAAQLTRCSTAA
jgi:hypothetical protein